jgi:hypothetical protein
MIIIECDICDNQITDNQDYFIIRDKSQWEEATIKVSLYVHKPCWNQVITNSVNFIKLQKANQHVNDMRNKALKYEATNEEYCDTFIIFDNLCKDLLK